MESSAGVGLLFIVRMVRRTEMRTEKAAPRTRSGEPTGLNVVAPLPLEHRPHEQRETQHRSNETHEGNQEPDPEQRIHERTRSLQRRLRLLAIPLPALRELVLEGGAIGHRRCPFSQITCTSRIGTSRVVRPKSRRPA